MKHCGPCAPRHAIDLECPVFSVSPPDLLLVPTPSHSLVARLPSRFCFCVLSATALGLDFLIPLQPTSQALGSLAFLFPPVPAVGLLVYLGDARTPGPALLCPCFPCWSCKGREKIISLTIDSELTSM